MSAVDEALKAIRRTVEELGVEEAAKQAGVPVSTLYEAKRRDFVGPSVITLSKLSALVAKRQAEGDPQRAA
jgi:predicted transcriptional regulator